MNRSLKLLLVAFAGLAGWAVADSAEEYPKVPYPQGYRAWTFLHSTPIGPKHGTFAKRPCEKPCTGGIFYFYANDKAMEGFRSGKFPDGAVIADEVLETSLSGDGNSAKEGIRRGVGVMVKDSKVYASTGGWGYASYDGDSQEDRNTAAEKKACFQCHVPRKDQDYVFTKYRER